MTSGHPHHRQPGRPTVAPNARQGRARSALLAMLMVLLLIATACPSSSTEAADGDDSGDTSNDDQASDGAGNDSSSDGSDGDGSTDSDGGGGDGGGSNPDVPREVDASGFDDHTVSAIASVEEYFALARTEEGKDQSVVKFTIPNLTGDDVDSRNTRWFDSNFYALHDEWYWFRLLNGQEVPLLDTEPVEDLSFETIQDAYDWAEAQDTGDLPLDLRFTAAGRMYSNEYYDLALRNDDKTYGLGSLVHYPPNELSDVGRWVIEMEFSELTTPESVEAFFTALSSTLPDEIGDNLLWVVRSPHQRDTAQEMEATGAAYADAVVQYRDLVPQGQVAVYNEGLAAGRLRLISPDGDELTDATDTDILIMENVPDWLPPASALLTSAPQTPLAHVNLLARNRGIPNASISGLLNDPAITRAAEIRSFAIVRATRTGELDITLITRDEFNEWQESQKQDRIAVPAVDPDDIDVTVDLTELATTLSSEAGPDGLGDGDIDDWRPIIGGKAAGFLTLLNTDGVTTPDQPLAVTVGPYTRHLAQVEDELQAMLTLEAFTTQERIKPGRARFLLLEGGEDFANTYPDEDDAEFLESFTRDHADDPAISAILEADGFKKLLRDTPMAAADLDALTEALETNFGNLSETQGLRFRSSSSVEDIEGFSGAGLYDSNTGYFDPGVLPDENDQNRTVEWAIKKTWASYWGFEAFEERRRENVDHQSGAMAVLVHPRFDDPLEVNNGVATVTLTDPSGADGEATVVINTQLGAVSVTNPDPDDIQLPEVVEVEVDGDDLTIERGDRSTLVPDGEVLTDQAIDELTDQLVTVTQAWRDQINADLNANQAVTTVTLDFEFKTMDRVWPAVEPGSTNGAPAAADRLVIKQARSLDPGLRGIPNELLAAPIPRDVLARAAKVDRYRCGNGTGWSILTDPLANPDPGFSEQPLELGRDVGDCEPETVLQTSDQLLVDLLATGTGLSINNS